MTAITCRECGNEIPNAATPCPTCAVDGRKTPARVARRISGWVQWVVLTLSVVAIVGLVVGWRFRGMLTTGSAANAPELLAPQLELQSWSWHREPGWLIAEGHLTNIGEEPLRNVQAVVTYTSRSGTVVATGDALLTPNPVRAGQTSSFSAITKDSEAIAGATIDFRELDGDAVNWRKQTTVK